MTTPIPPHSGAAERVRAPACNYFPYRHDRPPSPREPLVALGLKTVRAGHAVYGAGQATGRLYRMSGGCVLISQRLPDGRRSLVDFVAPGQYFGFSAADRHDCTATTATGGGLAIYDAANVMSDPGEAPVAFASAVAQLERARNLATLRSRRAVERLARFLLDLTPNIRIDNLCLELPLSRAEIGELLELQKETVSRCFAELRDAGAVAAEGRRLAHVRDRDMLAAIARGEAERDRVRQDA
jgi:CRP-like cAMP-binding protein